MPALVPVLVTPPAVAPVSLVEAKRHLSVEAADWDAQIEAFVQAATARLDGRSGVLGRCLIEQVWRLDLDGFPAADEIVLPFPDVSAATVTYSDVADAAQTLSSSDWSLHETAAGTMLALKAGRSWPATATRVDAVRIAMTAGYGSTAAAVPQPIRSAILLMVGDLWRSREAGGAPADMLAGAAAALVAPYRRVPV